MGNHDYITSCEISFFLMKYYFRFTSIFAQYNVPYIARCKTLVKLLEQDIIYNEAHVHFTNNIPPKQLNDFILTEPFLIQVSRNQSECPKFLLF